MNELKQWRIKENLTMEELADEVSQELQQRNEPPNKFSKQQISCYETGKYKPQWYVMQWLAVNATNARVQSYARLALDILIKQEVEKALEAK
jgi:transcriptional regulator with XRE-family HTH domain